MKEVPQMTLREQFEKITNIESIEREIELNHAMVWVYIQWLEISKRLLKTLERAEIDSMTLIGVINWVARQPEFENL